MSLYSVSSDKAGVIYPLCYTSLFIYFLYMNADYFQYFHIVLVTKLKISSTKQRIYLLSEKYLNFVGTFL